MAEAESALLEVACRLEEIMSIPGPTPGPTPGARGQPSPAPNGADIDSSTLVLAADGYVELRKFSRQMLARIRK